LADKKKRTLFNYKPSSPLGVRGMPELDDHIKRINDKLQQLLKKNQQLQKDNERQSKLIATLQESKETNSNQIAELQQQVLILKISAGQMNDIERKEFEKMINQHLKEIDKCIALLSE
jgi:cell division septum initiation protein DivIVA